MKHFALAGIACVGALGAAAHGGVIAFENPDGAGHFEWAQSADGSVNLNSGLDLTSSAADQSTLANPMHSSFYHYYDPSDGSGFLSPADAGSVSRFLNEGATATFALALGEGEDVAGSGGAWTSFSIITLPGFGDMNLADGESGYLMVQFGVLGSPGDLHHGWIGVTRDGSVLDPFAWGYETDANTAITAGAGRVPAPAGAATLGMLLISGGVRRRR